MLAVIYTLTICGIALPFFTKSKPGIRLYKCCRDTTNARYAVNNRGYLEEIENSHVDNGYID